VRRLDRDKRRPAEPRRAPDVDSSLRPFVGGVALRSGDTSCDAQIPHVPRGPPLKPLAYPEKPAGGPVGNPWLTWGSLRVAFAKACVRRSTAAGAVLGRMRL